MEHLPSQKGKQRISSTTTFPVEKRLHLIFCWILLLRKRIMTTPYTALTNRETHLSTRLQARLLMELYSLLPENSQLWIATHSIGMVRKATELWTEDPNKVAFLDFGFRADGTSRNFDEAEVIEPVKPDRAFWARHYDIALDDLSKLVAPEQVVLCEGAAEAGSTAFDASCYNQIFSTEYPRTLFISVGSKEDVGKRVAQLVPLIEEIVRGTKIIRLRDRDEMTDGEVERAKSNGLQVLSRRNIESFLLSDEILKRLCGKYEAPEKAEILINMRDKHVAQGEGRTVANFKPAAQAVHHVAKQELPLTAPGETKEAFMIDVLTPLVTSDTETYAQLKRDIFGASESL